MTAFVLLSLLLMLLAVGFIAGPLMKRSRSTALALLLGLPALVAGLYWYKGHPEAITAAPAVVDEPAASQLSSTEAAMELQLAKEPGDFEGWVLLGRLRMSLEKYDQAGAAYAKALALVPGEPNVMVEYAEAQMRASPDRRFPPSAVALLEGVIAAHPQQQRALFFLGMHRLQQGDAAGAALTWEQLLPLLDEKTAAALLPQLNEARAMAGLAPLEIPGQPPAATGQSSLKLRIALAPGLEYRLPPDAVLFVYARGENGQAPPVAARRIPSPRLPVEIELADRHSVMPTQVLSSQARVLVGARLSASGSATPASGDIEVQAQWVELGPGASADLILAEIRQ